MFPLPTSKTEQEECGKRDGRQNNEAAIIVDAARGVCRIADAVGVWGVKACGNKNQGYQQYEKSFKPSFYMHILGVMFLSCSIY